MAVGAIPRSAIKAYAEEFAIVGEEFEAFHKILRMVDNDYLVMLHKSGKTDKEANIPVGDTDAVKAMMLRLQARQVGVGKRKH